MTYKRVLQAMAKGLAIGSLGLIAACSSYVKKEEFDTTVQGLRDADGDLQGQLQQMQLQFSEITDQLHTKFSDYDAQIMQFQSRLRVEMTAHFGYDSADLRDTDRPALDEFSDVIREHPDVLVTVEGFTDPAGHADYNKALGLRRAAAVREYLITHGRLNAENIRAVSYGEDPQRLVEPNAWGEAGTKNRRVALVIDYVGAVTE